MLCVVEVITCGVIGDMGMDIRLGSFEFDCVVVVLFMV